MKARTPPRFVLMVLAGGFVAALGTWVLLRVEPATSMVARTSPDPSASQDSLDLPPPVMADPVTTTERDILLPSPPPPAAPQYSLRDMVQMFSSAAEPDASAHLAFVSEIVAGLTSPHLVDCSREKSQLTYALKSGGKVVVHAVPLGVIIAVSADGRPDFWGYGTAVTIDRSGGEVTEVSGEAGGEWDSCRVDGEDLHARTYRLTRGWIRIGGLKILFNDETPIIEPLPDQTRPMNTDALLALAQEMVVRIDDQIARHCRLR